MGTSQQGPVSSTPEFAGILRKRLEELPRKDVAVETRIDPSLLGKFVGGTAALKLDDVSAVMRAVGLKAVDKDRVCVRRDELRYLRGLYARVQEHAPGLLDEDEA